MVFTDEIYDTMLFDGSKMTYMSSLISKTLCCSFGGLSKVCLPAIFAMRSSSSSTRCCPFYLHT